MGKVGSSWLTAVKRAFRSPSKDSERKGFRRRDDNDQDQEDGKKRDKRRWFFWKPLPPSSQEVEKAPASDIIDPKHAIVAAVATAAAAEAAVTSSQVAVEVLRFTRSANSLLREHYAAIKIQTTFRRFLARRALRALRALRGLVKLQALIRGHNVRKQVGTALRCMQALVRVQTRAREQRLRLSRESSSSITESSADRKYSMTREGSYVTDHWDDRPHTIEEIKTKLQSKDSAVKSEKVLANAFSHKLWRSSARDSSLSTFEGTDDERASVVSSANCLDRWMATRLWEIRSRASVDHCREYIKTVEVDTTRPYPTSSVTDSWQRRRRQPSGINRVGRSSPLQQRTPRTSFHHSPGTPSPAKAPPMQVRSASPRCSRAREEDRLSMAYTPVFCHHGHYQESGRAMPNYMAATESAKSRLRSQSDPRQRPSTLERERLSSIKKRLSYPVAEPQSLRSPSCKGPPPRSSMHYSSSNYSWCTESVAGEEVSPFSVSDGRRWLR